MKRLKSDKSKKIISCLNLFCNPIIEIRFVPELGAPTFDHRLTVRPCSNPKQADLAELPLGKAPNFKIVVFINNN